MNNTCIAAGYTCESINANPKPGHTFSRWYLKGVDTGITTSPYSIAVVTQPMTVKAYFSGCSIP